MEEKYLTIEELIALPKLSNPSINDNGTKVAYVKRQVDWDNNTFQWHVWIYEDGKHYQLTRGRNESYLPRWAPAQSLSSNTLAYLAKPNERDRKRQIFIKPEGDVTGIQVSYALEDISAFQWAPSGEGFFFISREVEANSIKKRREIYGEIEYTNREYRCNNLYYLDLQTGLAKTTVVNQLPKDLREGNENEEGNSKKEEKDELSIQFTALKNLHIIDFDVAPSGEKVALITFPSPNLAEQDKAEVYILDIHSQELKKLNIPFVGVKHDILFSPDSKYICFTYFRTGKWFDNKCIGIYNLVSDEVIQLSPENTGIDECIYPLRWTSKGILIWWQERISSYIGLVNLNGEVTSLIADTNSYIQTATISLDGENLVYIKGNSQECYDLYYNDLRITNQSAILENRAFAQKEPVRWLSLDGTEIEGILCKPVNFDLTKKYPLLVKVHGGPKSTSLAVALEDNIYPIESFIEKGFIVLQPNYRGSNGYGEKFRSLNYKDLGTGDYADIISGVDYLVNQGFVDAEKIGIMGWSQGGYISAFCTTYSNRFQAVSVGAGISNWVTHYVSTDIYPFTHYYLGDIPWNDMEAYQKASPMTYINSASTPTLIQHGDADKRVPVSNAYELYRGLCDVGVKTELVIFKNMGHGVNKPGMARALMKQNFIWFCHHILEESMNDFYLPSKELD
ncbi:MAG: S9 family peptidase [Calothrix sp. C42_A2020_038]|nr:S9 family peptidase [Calothrix sp. C42_A2020_038]